MVGARLLTVAIFIGSVAIPIATYSESINAGSPLLISSGSTTDNVETPTAVATGPNGSLAAWSDNTGTVQTSFLLADGSSWSMPVAAASSTTTNPLVCINSAGKIVVTWMTNSTVGAGNFPSASVSTDNGSTWAVYPIIPSGDSTTGGNYVPICANDQGFMATMTYYNSMVGYGPYFCFSADGASWSTEALINSGSINAGRATTVAVLGDLFMAVWVDGSGNAQTSVSSNMGGTWSMPVAITSDSMVSSEVSLSATSAGFLAVWAESNIAYSSFSTDGSAWSTPVAIATNLDTSDSVNIGLSGSSSGFVAAWQGSDENAYGSISTDNGSTWNSTIVGSNLNSIYGGIVGVSAVGEDYLFVWTGSWMGSGNNAISNFSGTSSAAPRSFSRPCNRR